jgi:DNA polymerase III alpha subunit (gram-positive type)
VEEKVQGGKDWIEMRLAEKKARKERELKEHEANEELVKMRERGFNFSQLKMEHSRSAGMERTHFRPRMESVIFPAGSK